MFTILASCLRLPIYLIFQPVLRAEMKSFIGLSPKEEGDKHLFSSTLDKREAVKTNDNHRKPPPLLASNNVGQPTRQYHRSHRVRLIDSHNCVISSHIKGSAGDSILPSVVVNIHRRLNFSFIAL